MRDETKNGTEVDTATGKSERTASKVDAGTHLSEQEVVTDALWKNKANTREVARVKMVSSEESSRAIVEMGNVELIELPKSSIQCPSCLHDVFEGTFIFICMCGKLMRPNKDVMSRFKESFEALVAPHYRTSSIVTRGSRYGPNRGSNITTRLETHCEVLQKV